MDKLRAALMRFMYRRYGVDDLYRASMALCLVLILVNAAARSPILSLALWLLMGLSLARVLSRNLPARRRENDAYLRLTRPLRRRLSLPGKRIRGFATYRYRRCPGCRAVIEIPRRKGKRTIDCPRCHTVFETRVSFF